MDDSLLAEFSDVGLKMEQSLCCPKMHSGFARAANNDICAQIWASQSECMVDTPS